MQSSEDSKRILAEVIKRQMAILGPDITLAKVKNVAGIELDTNGEVVRITGDPKAILSSLINEFVELSGLIVKKTMESILTSEVNNIVQNQAEAPPPVVSVAQAPQLTVPIEPAPIPQTQKETDNSILTANRDIEELNKMLNNLSTGNSK